MSGVKIYNNYFETMYYAELIFQDAEFDINRLSPIFGANILFKRLTVMRMEKGKDTLDYYIPLNIIESAALQALDIVEISYNKSYSTWKIVIEFLDGLEIKEFIENIKEKLNNLFSRIEINYYVRGLMFEVKPEFSVIWKDIEDYNLEIMIDLCEKAAIKETDDEYLKYFYAVSTFLSYASDANASMVDFTENELSDDERLPICVFSILLELERSEDVIKLAKDLYKESSKIETENVFKA